jgi:uncharacterized Tic20 family protein
LKIKYWLIGIVIAGTGLLLARVMPRFITQPALQLVVYLVGVALALAGLIIIVFGISKARGGRGD